MAVNRLTRQRHVPMTTVVGSLGEASQRVVLLPSVLGHVHLHRQITAWATEAGGQLFGTIDEAVVTVEVATGPYPGDERSRYRYRSNPRAAQNAIDQEAALGRFYLGEWHTHAEDCPSASGLDGDAMKRLVLNSRLNSSALLMMIVGRRPEIEGIALWAVSTESVWECSLSSQAAE